jgi:8-oxo-dGTP pyrophosphatase MutT (NUDIX family)
MRAGGAQNILRPETARVINENPFNGLDVGAIDALNSLEIVSGAISKFRPDPQLQKPQALSRPSAVLIGLFQSTKGVEVILTRRSHQLTNHRGEISFPGGRLDEGETVIAAALRETQEEIGINPSEAQVIAELSAMSTVVSNSHIVPIVARFEQRPEMRPMNSEVDRVFTVPLSELARTDTYSQEYWKFSDRELRINFFYLDDETIWGATARMLLQVMKLTLNLKTN